MYLVGEILDPHEKGDRDNRMTSGCVPLGPGGVDGWNGDFRDGLYIEHPAGGYHQSHRGGDIRGVGPRAGSPADCL